MRALSGRRTSHRGAALSRSCETFGLMVAMLNVHRFVIRAYPSPSHPKFHEWQKASLILFVADSDPHHAERKALSELEKRCWVPESFELRDTLIEDAVRTEGGEVWDAYLEAQKKGLFWLEELDSLPMCRKGETLWGSGPRLRESFVDDLISSSGGHRVTDEEAGGFIEKNADYVLGNYVLELKQFENEGLEVPTRQQKIAEIFERYMSEGPVHQLDPCKLSERDAQEYWEIVGTPIQKRIKAASKQVKSTINRLGVGEYQGGVILLNTGYLSVPHDFMVAMAERYAAKDTSVISKVIVISSWTITNGFDTVVNYGFHPHGPGCPELTKLKDTFWSAVTALMTRMIKGQLDPDMGLQEPMSPTHFRKGGKAFTFGVPQLESTLKKGK